MALKRPLHKCERCGVWSLNAPFCTSECSANAYFEEERRRLYIRTYECVHCKNKFESHKQTQYRRKSRGLPIVCSEKCEECFFIMHKIESPKKRVKKEKKQEPTKADMWLARKERKPNDIHLGDRIAYGSTFGKSILDSATRKRMWI